MSLADQLTDGQLDCCRYELRKRAAVLMTRDQVRNLLRGADQRRFCRMLRNTYPQAEAGGEGGLDTYERHILLDIFAERVAGVSHWPMNCDGEELSAKFLEGIGRAFKAGKLDIEE